MSTFRSSQIGSVNGTPLVINAPAGIVAGDFLLAIITSNYNGATYTPPAGWTQLGAVQGIATPEGQSAAVFWKVAGGSEPGSYTWTPDTSSQHGGAIGAWSGASAIAASTPTSNNSANPSPVTVTSPSVTTTAANQTIVLLNALDPTAAGTTTWSSLPAGFTERAVQGVGFPPYGAVWIADGVQAAQGASGTKTEVVTNGSGGNAGWFAWSVALQDAASGGGAKSKLPFLLS